MLYWDHVELWLLIKVPVRRACAQVSWVQRSITEILKLVSDGADTSDTGDAGHSYERLSSLCNSLELSWNIETPRWLLAYTTTNDAKPSFIAFSSDMPTVPAMLCIEWGERGEPEAETVYFSHLAGQAPRQGQV